MNSFYLQMLKTSLLVICFKDLLSVRFAKYDPESQHEAHMRVNMKDIYHQTLFFFTISLLRLVSVYSNVTSKNKCMKSSEMML